MPPPSSTSAKGPPLQPLGHRGAMERVQVLIRRVAGTEVTVLIEGESGTGKELVARTLHASSLRRDGPFVAVNCAALSETILESELFGHVRGAFTGALADKPGRFALARGGTLFLDEIGDLSPLGQADLLRVLEDGIYRPLGSRTTVRADVRVLAATNKNLAERCGQGLFREDLLYRLNVITIPLPPLRERRDDIPELATRFCREFSRRHGRRSKTLSPALVGVLQALPWPGNVRQLRNSIEHMVLVSPREVLEAEDLPPQLRGPDPVRSQGFAWRPEMTLAQIEEAWVHHVLRQCQGHRTRAAVRLGISRRALHYRLSQSPEVPGA